MFFRIFLLPGIGSTRLLDALINAVALAELLGHRAVLISLEWLQR